MVAQAACLVEGSNQHCHHYHRRGFHFYFYYCVLIVLVVFYLVWVCEGLVWDYARRPGTRLKTMAALGGCLVVTQAAWLGKGSSRHRHHHRRGGHY